MMWRDKYCKHKYKYKTKQKRSLTAPSNKWYEETNIQIQIQIRSELQKKFNAPGSKWCEETAKRSNETAHDCCQPSWLAPCNHLDYRGENVVITMMIMINFYHYVLKVDLRRVIMSIIIMMMITIVMTIKINIIITSSKWTQLSPSSEFPTKYRGPKKGERSCNWCWVRTCRRRLWPGRGGGRRRGRGRRARPETVFCKYFLYVFCLFVGWVIVIAISISIIIIFIRETEGERAASQAWDSFFCKYFFL